MATHFSIINVLRDFVRGDERLGGKIEADHGNEGQY